jgi:Protein of unknown function (DUF3574)
MRSFRLLGAGAFALLIMTMPILAQGIACSGPQKPMLEIDLMFGRNIGGELGVTEQQWADFVAGEITPRFPQGLSIDDALGQWRDPDKNTIVKEPSKDVTIVVPQGEEVEGKIEDIVAAYKQRFQQQSVGVVMRPACVSF